MCTPWEVSEEALSGKRNDVCSSAAELGHQEVERERERERKKLTATESTGWRSCACFAHVIFKKNPPSHRCHQGVSSADFKLCPSVFLRVAPPQRALIKLNAIKT